LYNLIVIDECNVLMVNLTEELDYCDCLAPFLLVKRGDVNAGHHLLDVVLLVKVYEDLPISLFEIEDFRYI